MKSLSTIAHSVSVACAWFGVGLIVLSALASRYADDF